MIQQLHDVTRLEASAIPIAYRHTDLHELIREAVADISAVASTRNVTVDTGFHVGEADAEVDPDLIRRSIDNLLDNAVRYTPDGGRVSVVTLSRGDSVEIRVLDDGLGIPENMRSGVFQPLVRAEVREASPTTHHGLGLAMVDLVAREHGGTVTVQCPEQGGSVFSLVLPRVQPKFSSAREQAIEQNRRRGVDQTSRDLFEES